MNREQLNAIRQRAEAATKGPWRVGNGNFWGQSCCIESDDAEDGGVICETVHANVLEEKANLDFIAHAREDVPALLAEIERLQDQLHAARQVCDAARAVFESGAMYDAGDLCRECGAERWEDGNCDHKPGCTLGELETQVMLWINSLLPRM